MVIGMQAYHSRTEIARALGVSPATVTRWGREGLWVRCRTRRVGNRTWLHLGDACRAVCLSRLSPPAAVPADRDGNEPSDFSKSHVQRGKARGRGISIAVAPSPGAETPCVTGDGQVSGSGQQPARGERPAEQPESGTPGRAGATAAGTTTTPGTDRGPGRLAGLRQAVADEVEARDKALALWYS